MRAYPPLPVNDDWVPDGRYGAALRSRGDTNRDFAFTYADPQGMRSWSGIRFHGAVDWFAPAGCEVAAPGPGRVVRVNASRGTSGQVFGGVLTIEEDTGICWVMRHVVPQVRLGDEVAAGDIVALVSAWDDGGEHLHLEVWKSLEGGYRWENALDPKDIEWTISARETPDPVSDLYLEELPAAKGGTGPDVVGWYTRLSYAENARRLRALRGERVSTLAADDRFYVLRWAPGTHGCKFRFGPWSNAGHRTRVLEARQANTGRTQRVFDGRALSLYPWPKEG